MTGLSSDSLLEWLVAVRKFVGEDAFYAALHRLWDMGADNVMQPIAAPLYHWLGADADA